MSCVPFSSPIKKPGIWEKAKKLDFTSPNPYVVVFLNGEAAFITPPTAVASRTYEPEWNVLMNQFMKYNHTNKDEVTIVVLDKVTDVLGKVTSLVSESKLTLSVWGVSASVDRIKEQAFRDDNRLGRWSGPIPRDYLIKTGPTDWELSSFEQVELLRMRIESLPMADD